MLLLNGVCHGLFAALLTKCHLLHKKRQFHRAVTHLVYGPLQAQGISEMNTVHNPVTLLVTPNPPPPKNPEGLRIFTLLEMKSDGVPF